MRTFTSFVLFVGAVMLASCGGSKRTVDILGAWESVEKVKIWGAYMEQSINITSDTVEFVPGKGSPMPYVVVEEKQGEIVLAVHPPGSKKELRFAAQRKGDLLWLKSGPEGVTQEFKRARAALSETEMVVVRASMKRMRRNMKRGEAMQTMKQLQSGLEMYYASYGRYPAKLNQLTTGRRPVLKRSALVDAWGNPFRYSVSDKKFYLCSHGPDGAPGSSDDLCL